MSGRPERLVAVVGTGTEVGKTWVTCAVLRLLRQRNVAVAARKPAQSYAVGDLSTDAEALGAASGEPPEQVCPSHRCYAVAFAPPMAADALGRPAFRVADLIAELTWPSGVGVGFVETAGGVRSPIADDGDCADLLRLLRPDAVLLVADAGLGTINAVRLSVQALSPYLPMVFLNRFDAENDLHRRNLAWLRERDGLHVVADLDELAFSITG